MLDPLPSVHRLIEAGRLDDAIQFAEQELRLATGHARVVLLTQKSLALVTRGDILLGMRAANEAREYACTLHDSTSEAEAWLAMGFALQATENHASAIEAIGQAERAAVKAANLSLQARALRRLGISYSVLGRHEQAAETLANAAGALKTHGTHDDWCHARYSVLTAQSRAIEQVETETLARKAAYRALIDAWRRFSREMHECGMARLAAMAHGNAGIAARHAGDVEIALTLLNEATAKQAAISLRGHRAVTQSHIGAIYQSVGRHEEAISALRLGITLLEGGSPRELTEAWYALADAYESADDPRAALAAYKTARMHEKSLHDDDAHIAATRREQQQEIERLSLEWSQLADRDALTGAPNRRAFDRDLGNAIASAANGVEHTLLIIDLDHFKRINDQHGHATGDAVLKRFSALLGKDQRNVDRIARIGGEEFALIAQCPKAEGVEIALRLLQRVRGEPWCAIAEGLTLTISVGVASTRELHADAANLSADALFALADHRTYAAKSDGRDRVASGA